MASEPGPTPDPTSNTENNVQPQLKCFLKCNSSEAVHPFTEEKLKKCSDALEVRKILKIKYGDERLPKTASVGYHSRCYSAVTALSAKQHEQSIRIKTALNPNKPQQSEVPATSSTDRLVK